jgi:hypothetical protein
MLNGLSPETLDSLVSEALALLHTNSAAATGSAEFEELKRHKAELQDLKIRICSTIITC